MRTIRYVFLVIIAVALVTVALANRQMVTLRLAPQEIADLFGIEGGVALPLFVVMFGSIAIGLMVGFVWEWLREHRYRSEGARARRDARRMEREVSRLDGAGQGGDDVLALLGNDGRGR